MGYFDSFNILDLFGGGGFPGMPGGGGSSGMPGFPGMPGGGGSSGMPGFPGMPGGGGSSGMGMPGGSGGGMGGLDFMNPMSMLGGGESSGLFGGSSGGGVLGALTGSEAIYGKKPAAIPITSPEEILRQNVAANLSVSPQVSQLAAQQNSAEQQSLIDSFKRSIPGYEGIQSARARNISEMLTGVPKSVVDKLQREAAARGAGAGTIFSVPNTQADFLRSLGIEDLAYKNAAEKNAESFIENTRKYTIPTPFNTDPFFLKPAYDPYNEQTYAKYRADVDAAPVPAAAGAAAAQTAAIESLLAVYSGTPHSAQPYNQNQNSYAGPRTYNPNVYYNQPTGGFPDSSGMPRSEMLA
jgi:hypothetical protein